MRRFKVISLILALLMVFNVVSVTAVTLRVVPTSENVKITSLDIDFNEVAETYTLTANLSEPSAKSSLVSISKYDENNSLDAVISQRENAGVTNITVSDIPKANLEDDFKITVLEEKSLAPAMKPVTDIGQIVYEDLSQLLESGGENPPDIVLSESDIPKVIDGSYTNMLITSDADAIKSLDSVKNIMQMNDPKEEVELVNKEVNESFNTYRLQQMYQGLPVYGKQLVIATDEKGNATSLSGYYVPNIELNINPAMTAAQAAEFAIAAVGLTGSDDVETSEPQLLIYALECEPTLAYAVEVCGVTDTEFVAQKVFINAINGECLFEESLISGATLTDTFGNPRDVTLTEDIFGIAFKDPNRNIEIYKTLLLGPDFSKYVLPGVIVRKDVDNDDWTDYEDAITALANLSDVYDYYKALGRDSFDGRGATIKATINYGTDLKGQEYDNAAYYNGLVNKQFIFGEGVGKVRRNYSAAKDIVGHEFTHAVEDYTVGLVRSGESYALKEAYADIMGILIEGENDNDWLLGEDVFVTPGEYSIIRNISDPTSRFPVQSGAKEKYGEYWDVPDDNVYNRSTVISHAAYLMWKNGITDKKKLAELWYKSLGLLVPTSDFEDCARMVLLAAKGMRMSDSEIEIIENAFIEVKVLSPKSKTIVIVRTESGEALGGAVVSLENASGVTKIVGTANNGFATFTDIEAGVYTVTISKSGYFTINVTNVNIANGNVMDYELILTTIRGQVASTRMFLSGVKVEMKNANGIKTAMTDANGKYTITGLMDTDIGPCTLTFSKSEHLTKVVNVDVTNSKGNVVDCVLEEGYMIQGKVTNENGTALSGAKVEVKNEAETKTAMTDINGEYTITGLQLGDCIVTVTGEKCIPQELNVTLSQKITTLNYSLILMPSAKIREVVHVNYHTAIITNDNELFGCGRNNYGQIGDGTTVNALSPVKVLDDVLSVSVTPNNTYAIKTNGELWAWGLNGVGQVGNGTTENVLSPVKVLDDVSSVVCVSTSNTYAIKTNGELWAWGNGGGGQVGNGTTGNVLSPVKVLDDVISIEVNNSHVIAMKTNRELWSWGNNTTGQVGNGSSAGTVSSPAKVLDDVSSAVCGSANVYAITTNRELWAWGNGGSGQLGNGTYPDVKRPIKVLDGVLSVSAVYNTTTYGITAYAIKTNGELWAWGANVGGQVGNGTTTAYIPSPVKVLNDVSSVVCSTANTYAIKTNGELWAWGTNGGGQVGNGTTGNVLSPVKVLDNVASVSASDNHAMAIKTNGELWSWGNNTYGQVGNGTYNTNVLSPVKVLDDVLSACGTVYNSYVMKTNRELWSWGNNAYGQIGNGATERVLNPIKVFVW